MYNCSRSIKRDWLVSLAATLALPGRRTHKSTIWESESVENLNLPCFCENLNFEAMAVAVGQQSEKLSPAEFQQLQDLAACQYLIILSQLKVTQNQVNASSLWSEMNSQVLKDHRPQSSAAMFNH